MPGNRRGGGTFSSIPGILTAGASLSRNIPGAMHFGCAQICAAANKSRRFFARWFFSDVTENSFSRVNREYRVIMEIMNMHRCPRENDAKTPVRDN